MQTTPKSIETVTPTDLSVAGGLEPIFFAFDSIPDHYLGRLDGPASDLYAVMGIQVVEQGVLLPTKNIQKHVNAQGFNCHTDFKPAGAGVISPKEFLEVVQDGDFPLANPWHDLVFHGPALISATKELIELNQEVASAALGSGNSQHIEDAVNAIDTAMGNPFIDEGEKGLISSQEKAIADLFQLTGLPQAGDSMVEAMRRVQTAAKNKANAKDYALRYAAAAKAALQHAKDLQGNN